MKQMTRRDCKSYLKPLFASFGDRQFSASKAMSACHPNKPQGWFVAEARAFEDVLAAIAKKKYLRAAPGPRGGKGYVLTDAGIVLANS